MVDSSHDAGARTRWIGLTSRILVPCSALQIRARLRLVLSVFAVVVSSRGSWAAFTCVMRHMRLVTSCRVTPGKPHWHLRLLQAPKTPQPLLIVFAAGAAARRCRQLHRTVAVI